MLVSISSDRASSVILCISSLLSLSYAQIAHVATVTSTCHNVGLLHQKIAHTTPRPAPAAELRARQAQVSLATCGYINGDGDLAVTCNTNYYCATTATFVGCCERNNCLDIFTKCFDLLGAACDQACQNNPQNLVCPSTLPYCARYNYEGGSVGLGCARVSGYTTTVLLTTRSSISEFIPSASPSTIVTPTAIPGKSGLSTGATAGIAVGATLGVVAVLLLAFFFWRRNRRAKRASTEAEPIASYHDAKEVDTNSRPDRDSKLSELPSSPRTPLSPDFYANRQPSPGLPKYTQNSPTEYYEMVSALGKKMLGHADDNRLVKSVQRAILPRNSVRLVVERRCDSHTESESFCMPVAQCDDDNLVQVS